MYDPAMMLSEAVKQLRRQRFIGQKELGAMIGVDSETISKAENAHIRMFKKHETLRKLAELLQVPPTEIQPNPKAKAPRLAAKPGRGKM